MNDLPSSKMTLMSTCVFLSPAGVCTLILSLDSPATATASRLPNFTVTPPRPGWNPLPVMITSSPPVYVPLLGSTSDTFSSLEQAESAIAARNDIAKRIEILLLPVGTVAQKQVDGKLAPSDDAGVSESRYAFAVGRTAEPVTYEVERGHIRRFADAIGDDDPVYRGE